MFPRVLLKAKSNADGSIKRVIETMSVSISFVTSVKIAGII